MPLYFKNVAVIAKQEVTYGTDPVPTGVANAILTKGAIPQPLLGNRVTRDLDRSTWGAQSEINTGPYVTVSFSVEIAGGGAAGTAPKYGPLLLACGMSETTNAGVSVVYAPASTALKSCTIYYYVDGQQHIIKGARGNVSINMQRGQIPTFDFQFTGLYTRPTVVANPALTLTSFQAPVAVTKTNTPTFSLHSYSAFCEAFTADYGNQIVYRNLIGAETVELTDRNVRGSVTIEAPAIGTKDYFAASEAHAGITLSTVQLVHGTTAGNIVQFDGPKVQLGGPTVGNSDGIVTYTMDTIFTANASNDELVITVK
jgi:hypothetical protein